MPFVNIRIVKEVIADAPEAKKAAINERVVAAISEVTGLAEDQVWVVFEEVAETDWFVGDQRVKELRAAARGR
jgi:4-oxalocrotonate tautomerase